MNTRVYSRKNIGSIDLRQTVDGYEASVFSIDGVKGVVYVPHMPVFEDECFSFVQYIGDFQPMTCNYCGMRVMNDRTKAHFEKCDATYEHYYGRKRSTNP